MTCWRTKIWFTQSEITSTLIFVALVQCTWFKKSVELALNSAYFKIVFCSLHSEDIQLNFNWRNVLEDRSTKFKDNRWSCPPYWYFNLVAVKKLVDAAHRLQRCEALKWMSQSLKREYIISKKSVQWYVVYKYLTSAFAWSGSLSKNFKNAFHYFKDLSDLINYILSFRYTYFGPLHHMLETHLIPWAFQLLWMAVQNDYLADLN